MDLSHPVVVGLAPSQEVLSRGDSQLPSIFFRAMRGVNTLVDAFLGTLTFDLSSDLLPASDHTFTELPTLT